MRGRPGTELTFVTAMFRCCREDSCINIRFLQAVDLVSLLTNILNPGIKPRSPTLKADSLPSEPPGKP